MPYFSPAFGNGEPHSTSPDLTENEAEWLIVPGTGDIDFVEVQKACPCPNGDLEPLGYSLLTPVQLRVTVQPQAITIQAINQNCSSAQQSWTANYEYTTQHEAGAHASGSVTASTEVSTGGLLSTVIAEGKVGVAVSGEIGGSYDYTNAKVHREERQYTMPACAGLFVASFYVDYYAEARQYEVDHLCCRTIEYIDIDGTIVESCGECYKLVTSMSAYGDGDSVHVNHLQEFHPCTVGCVTTNKNPVSRSAALEAEVDDWEDGLMRSWQPSPTRDEDESPAGGG